jgi:hypothetical protein
MGRIHTARVLPDVDMNDLWKTNPIISFSVKYFNILRCSSGCDAA